MFCRLKSVRRSASRASTGSREATCTRRPTTESESKYMYKHKKAYYRK